MNSHDDSLSLIPPEVMVWLKRLAVITPALLGLAMIYYIRLKSAHFMVGREPHWAPQIGFATPIAFAFMFWMRLWDQGRPFHSKASLPFSVAACVLFAFAGAAAASPLWFDLRAPLTSAAIIAAILMVCGSQRPWASVRSDPSAAVVALLLGCILWLHEYLHEHLWAFLCETTANVMKAFALVFFLDPSITTTDKNFIRFGTEHFRITLEPPCSGMDGMAIFFALLTLALLFDWKHFRHFKIWRIYAAGFLVMFLVNALRIQMLFLLGHISHHPLAPRWMEGLRDVMYAMFHEHVGWLIYAVTFGLFMLPLYRMALAPIPKQNRWVRKDDAIPAKAFAADDTENKS